jgi:Zn-finger nucleic acid-binding protein
MHVCPVCRSARIVQVINATRRAFCIRCGARWVQDGPSQRAVERVTRAPDGEVREPALSPPP